MEFKHAILIMFSMVISFASGIAIYQLSGSELASRIASVAILFFCLLISCCFIWLLEEIKRSKEIKKGNEMNVQ